MTIPGRDLEVAGGLVESSRAEAFCCNIGIASLHQSILACLP